MAVEKNMTLTAVLREYPSEIPIRPYTFRDRAVVRSICCATADRGRPLENIYPDCELVADLVTRYYTDIEPGFSWVAGEEGQVAGYLTGAPDTRRCNRIMAFRVGPRAVLAAMGRGALRRRQNWLMLKALALTPGCLLTRRHFALDDFPAHLHIDILAAYRGRGVGRRLMAEFLVQLKEAGRRGVHAFVRSDNSSACSFFERQGFRALDRCSLPLPQNGGAGSVPNIVYGLRIGGEVS